MQILRQLILGLSMKINNTLINTSNIILQYGVINIIHNITFKCIYL